MKAKTFKLRMTREASYVEVIDTEIIAESEEAAIDIAVSMGNGGQVAWPVLKRYNVVEKEPVDYTFIKVETPDG